MVYRVGDIARVRTESMSWNDVRLISKWLASQIGKHKTLIANVINVYKEDLEDRIVIVEIMFESGRIEFVSPKILEHYEDTHLPEVTKEEVSDFLWD